ncbi:RidA family protein [Jiangella gansuensis]|uniref:RidA family protein n=1 Tax=Jiangella gansuensis TaxID=281473 RepID=UPI000479CA76|nr:RidA family protein [Jiangella gansuensis]
MRIEHVEPNPDNPPKIPLSSGVRVANLLFVSGQASTVPGQGIVPGTFDEEFHRTIQNVEAVLAAGGATLRDVVQVRAYLRDESARSRFNELYAEVFSEPYPARTTVGNHFSFIQIEIDCVAVLPDSGA